MSKFNDLKLKKKLMLGFSIVAILTIVVGTVGVMGMKSINSASNNLYQNHTKPMPDIAKVLEYSQRLRIQLRNLVLYTGDMNKIREIESDLNKVVASFEGYIDAYDIAITDQNIRKYYDEGKKLYENSYKPSIEKILAGAKKDTDQAVLLDILSAVQDSSDSMVDNFTKCMEIDIEDSKITLDENTNLSDTMLIIIIFSIVVAVLLSLVIAIYISNSIGGVLINMKEALMQIGTEGNLMLTPAMQDKLIKASNRKDEVGQCLGALIVLVNHLQVIENNLGIVADGDLSIKTNLMSDQDTIGIAVNKMLDGLNHMFGEINNSTDQVSTGAKQISDGAQILAQGTTQQAAAIQQLSTSIGEIANKTIANADKAKRASILSELIREKANKGNQQMDQMITAVMEINEASQSISEVIKVIDGIAFQTNILALNAAVEAARAGVNGKGFAVVAEEVRSLAAKSSEAAKKTGVLIENSIEKAMFGTKIAQETAASLNEIISGINESGKVVSDIAESSEEQSDAIKEINKGIDQVSQVVQQNSATSEESAASSQQMSAQADTLAGLSAQFKLRDDPQTFNKVSKVLRIVDQPSPSPSSQNHVLPVPYQYSEKY